MSFGGRRPVFFCKRSFLDDPSRHFRTGYCVVALFCESTAVLAALVGERCIWNWLGVLVGASPVQYAGRSSCKLRTKTMVLESINGIAAGWHV